MLAVSLQTLCGHRSRVHGHSFRELQADMGITKPCYMMRRALWANGGHGEPLMVKAGGTYNYHSDLKC
jgi:hypothetical protein